MRFAFEKGNKWEESKIPVELYKAPAAQAPDENDGNEGNEGEHEIMYQLNSADPVSQDSHKAAANQKALGSSAFSPTVPS